MPPSQKAVAFPLLIHRRARAGVVGINGFWQLSHTGTNMCDKPPCGVSIFPSLLIAEEEQD
jgi:hypothetical protein